MNWTEHSVIQWLFECLCRRFGGYEEKLSARKRLQTFSKMLNQSIKQTFLKYHNFFWKFNFICLFLLDFSCLDKFCEGVGSCLSASADAASLTQLVKCNHSHHHWTCCVSPFCISACFSSWLQTDQENTVFTSERRQGSPQSRRGGAQTSKHPHNTTHLMYSVTFTELEELKSANALVCVRSRCHACFCSVSACRSMWPRSPWQRTWWTLLMVTVVWRKTQMIVLSTDQTKVCAAQLLPLLLSQHHCGQNLQLGP